jgi:hypothetical protein
MNLDTLLGRLEGLVVALQDGLRREVETVAQDGLVLVTQRVSETGTDANGAKFKPYTPEYERFKRFAVGTAKKEGAKKRATRKTAVATPEKPVGRYRGFVDFTLSGQMFSSAGLSERGTPILKNITPAPAKQDGSRITVVVSGRDLETKLKMEGNDNNRPGWFRLSEKEQETLALQSSERLGRFVKKFIEQ